MLEKAKCAFDCSAPRFYVVLINSIRLLIFFIFLQKLSPSLNGYNFTHDGIQLYLRKILEICSGRVTNHDKIALCNLLLEYYIFAKKMQYSFIALDLRQTCMLKYGVCYAIFFWHSC